MQDNELIEVIHSTKPVYDGVIVHLEHLTVTLPDGKTALREVARHVGASAVVPVDENNMVYLVRQFRAPLNRVTLEIPAGKLDSRTEDRLLAAQRELREETGFHADSFVKLTDLATTPGFCDEVISLYLATGLHAGATDPDDDEFLHLVKMPFADAVKMVCEGKITDSKTIAGLLLTEKALSAQR